MKKLKTPRDSRRDAGFTLLELAIVLCVMGILSAILVPSVVDIVKRAEETAALQNCRTYYEQLAFYTLDEPSLAIDDYIYVSGDYAFVMEKGELKAAEGYTAEDGELLSETGGPVSDVVRADLPEELEREAVTVYMKATSSEAVGETVYDEEAKNEACNACWSVLNGSELNHFDFQKGSVFVYGNYAFDFNGAKLELSEMAARDGVLLNSSGYTQFDFTEVSYDPGDVKVYEPVKE